MYIILQIRAISTLSLRPGGDQPECPIDYVFPDEMLSKLVDKEPEQGYLAYYA